jgi:toxin ParE1/3/4
MSVPKKIVVLSAEARADLNGILLCTWQQWGEERRDRYKAMLDRALATLSDYPEIGPQAPRFFPGCCVRHVEHHVIYYQILNGEIEIVRILHERADPTQHFQS